MDYNLGYYHGIGSKSATDNHHKQNSSKIASFLINKIKNGMEGSIVITT